MNTKPGNIVHKVWTEIQITWKRCVCCVFLMSLPSGIFLTGTELLQSPFRMEFSMGSRSRRYRRFLRNYRRFLRSYHRSLRACGVVAIPEATGGRRCGDAESPIVARIAKHHKTLLNIVKHHETHVKHREPLVNHHETLKTLWNIMKQSSFDATISALDVETSAIARRSFDSTISMLDAETSSLDAVMRRRRRWMQRIVK